MNIQELDAYNLNDAVKFHDQLNPRLWDEHEHLRPEVRGALLEIAADFEEFLGLDNLAVQDITISGSNAAYNYTDHSDIDLHLIVDMPQGSAAEVYRELFDAKKYQYNESHNIRIGGYDVELYVQDSQQPHHSQGIYSVKNGNWLSVPRRRSADIDDMAVRSKYEDIGARIENLVDSGSHEQLSSLMDKIKTMRRSGLSTEGEFSVENIVFKLLRNNGLIKQLIDARTRARDAELSLTERSRKKKKTRVKYGYGGYWTPGFDFGGTELGGDSVNEASTPDGVSPSTKMFLEQDQLDTAAVIKDFVKFCADKLGIGRLPRLMLRRDPAWSQRNHSFGNYDPDTEVLNVSVANRHIMDSLRTVAHELVHYRQGQIADMPDDAGETGSDYENEANARAGVLMRDYAQQHPEYFKPETVAEAASGYIPTKRQARDPRFSTALTVDIKPGQVGREANKLKLKTDSQGQPALLIKNLLNALREFKESEQLDVDTPSLNKIAKKHHVDISFLKQQLVNGTKVEQEHTSDPRTAQEIALDHLNELPDYYIKLKQIEQISENQELFEINMSPTNLKRLVRDIPGALAGMEFEMIVPNTADTDDYEIEPDYDQDERSRSFSDIEDFFNDGNYNSQRDVDRALDSLREEFYESLDETIDEEFYDNTFDIVREYIEIYVDEDYIMGINGLDLSAEDQERFQEDQDFRRKVISDYTEQAIENQTQDYENAQQAFRDDRFSEADESEWLRRNYPYMSDVQNNTNLTWPYYTEHTGGDVSIKEIADDFQDMIGKPVNHSSNYHGARRAPGTYVVEPDGSLEADNDRDGGLEFVSPPMPLDELLVDLEKVKKWADKIGAYTNDSTGLHINVSVPGMSTAKLDYVKLALLLGDERVLNEFGRISNNYTKSAMKIVRDRIRDNPAQAQEILDKMRGHLEALATKLIHTGETSKYTSINTKGDYVEFRSPGGDWLDTNYELIVPSAMRFVVALDAAMNPDKYRQEYLKKLYKALAPAGDEDPIAHFARYVAGEVPKQALKSFVRQVQLKRQASRDAARGQKYWWEVKRPGYFASIEVVAASREEALAKAVEPGNYPDWAGVTNLQATPIKPYKETPADQSEPTEIGGSIKYEIFRRADDSIVRQFWSANDDMARSMAIAWFEEQGSERRGYGLRRVSARLGTDRANTRTQEPTDDSPEQSYEIYNKQTGAVVGEPFMLRSDQQALTRLTDYQHFGQHGLDRDTAEATFGVRRAPIPGSTLDLQRQRAQQQSTSSTDSWVMQPYTPPSGGGFTGHWLILNSDNRIIYKFGGIGNSQSDANRHAMEWLRRHPGMMQDGVTVVPEMG